MQHCRLPLPLLLVMPLGAQANWTALTLTARPSPSEFCAMTFDLGRGESVLFGGGSRSGPFLVLDETWTWDGATWARRNPATSPSPRWLSAMVYEVAQGRVLLFGGGSGGAPFVKLQDTWSWDGVNWTQLAPVASPPARTQHAMAYDALRGRVVLFGGIDTAALGDTWEFDGVNWIARTPATSPAARWNHALAYDTARGVTVLFGGNVGANGTASNDTYEYDGTSWTHRLPATSPPPRFSFVLQYDPLRGVHVLFAGWDANLPNVRSDTWEWNGTVWTQRSPNTLPPGRAYASSTYDWVRQELVMFGGEISLSSFLGDTWKYQTDAPATFSQYGTGCPGGLGVPSLAATSGPPWLGDPVSTILTNVPAGALAFLAFGFQRAQVNLGTIGIPGCTQLLLPIGNILLLPTGTTATWTWQIPNSLALAGVTFQLQGVTLQAGGSNPIGAALSNGLEGQIGAR